MRTTRSTPRPRSDGWTPARQLDFLSVLARTRSVSRAAKVTGMSRESAYRLRRREPDGLFALTWARTLGPTHQPRTKAEVDEGHRSAIAAACAPAGRVVRRTAPQRQHCDAGQAARYREGHEVEEVEDPLFSFSRRTQYAGWRPSPGRTVR